MIDMTNILIIEDEPLAQQQLQDLLQKQSLMANFSCHAESSVEGAIDYLKTAQPDLIFMDIHLGDGDSFEILESLDVTAPIIFTTAYSQYALDSFKHFTLDYLLKPFGLAQLEKAIEKYGKLQPQAQNTDRKTRFLVSEGYQMFSLNDSDIAYFMAVGKRLFIYTLAGKSYLFDDTIINLSQQLDAAYFFRINRKLIVNIKAIVEVEQNAAYRLQVELRPKLDDQEDGVVSKALGNDFKIWMGK
jgi:two-component system, LytTR family, response regulator LytT